MDSHRSDSGNQHLDVLPDQFIVLVAKLRLEPGIGHHDRPGRRDDGDAVWRRLDGEPEQVVAEELIRGRNHWIPAGGGAHRLWSHACKSRAES